MRRPGLIYIEEHIQKHCFPGLEFFNFYSEFLNLIFYINLRDKIPEKRFNKVPIKFFFCN